MENGNLANYENNEVKEILRDIYSISDEKTLKEKYTRLQDIYQDDRPYIGLYFSKMTTVSVKGVSKPADNNWFDVFYGIENWNKK